MTRNLLLLLVAVLCIQVSRAQQASVLGNVLWDSYNERIVVRIAIRNNTNASTNCQIAAIRIGYQFNESVLTFSGFRSYFYNGIDPNSGLNDPSYYTGAGGKFNPDSNTPVDDGTRLATIISNGAQKILRKNYINRSTTDCNNLWVIPSQTYRVAMDLYFKFKSPYLPADYGLTSTGYGFGLPGFIAQFITDINQALNDPKKEIAVLIDHTGGSPYQPWDQSGSTCSSGSLNPVPITDNAVNFISPINGVLLSDVKDFNIQKKTNDVIINWEGNNNDLVDHYEIERKQGNGTFKTVGMIMSDNSHKTIQFEFKDKNVPVDMNLYYRIKIQGADNAVTYSDIKMVRAETAQGSAIIMYPNPATDIVNVKLTNTAGNFVYRIYSSDGRMLMNGNISLSNPQINISQLKTGSYFVDIYQPQSGSRHYSQFKKQ
jgi:hypothetical protein